MNEIFERLTDVGHGIPNLIGNWLSNLSVLAIILLALYGVYCLIS